MTLRRAVFRNLLGLLAGKAGNLVISFVTVILVTRALGVEGFGQYATALAFVQLFSVTGDFGLSIVANTELGRRAKSEWQSFFSALYTLRILIALVVIGAAPLVALLFPYSGEIHAAIVVASFATFALMLREPLVAIFQNALRTGWVAIAEIAGKLVILLGTLLVLGQGGGVLGVLGALTIGNAVMLSLTIIAARRRLPFSLHFAPLLWKKIAILAWPTGISLALNIVYFKGDTVLLSLFRTQHEVGLYSAPYKILEVLTVFPALFTGLILPSFVRAFERRDRVLLSRYLTRVFEGLSLIALPIVVGTFFVGEELMARVAGEDFRLSGVVMKILALAIALIYFGTFTTSAVVAVGKQRAMLPFYVGVAVAAVAGYLWAIPAYGMWGAAWMTVATETCILLFSLRHVLRATDAHFEKNNMLKIVIASLGMGVVLALLPNLSLIPMIVMAVLTYGVALWLLRVVTPHMVRELLSLRSVESEKIA